MFVCTFRLEVNLEIFHKPSMSADIVAGFDNAGIRVEKIVSIQRRFWNNTWTVAFTNEDAKASALAVPSTNVAGCQVFVADSEHSTVVVKLYEIPFEMPDSAVVGRLSHYGRVLSFHRGRHPSGLLNGVRTARMRIVQHIPSCINIAGELAFVYYALQPVTCRKYGGQGHLAAKCRGIRCFNCEPGHSAELANKLSFAKFA